MKKKYGLYAIILILIVAVGLWYASGKENAGEDRNTHPEQEKESGLTGEENLPSTGWVTIDATRYYYQEDGTCATGWVTIDGRNHFFLENGALASGWVTIDAHRCCLDSDGCLLTGWQEIDGSRYYLDENGTPLTGIQQIDGKTHCFQEDGAACTGWVTIENADYYCLEDGAFATSPLEINGEMCYFTPTGIHVVLVNPWTPLPAEQQTDLLPLDSGFFVAVESYDALKQMLADCASAGYHASVCSAYRTQADQEYLYQRKVDYYLDCGYEQEEAEELAGTVVAVPGTSEHQLGLAVDIIDDAYPYLDEKQADTDAQKWLMEHCWEYGFILRYPVGSTDITGIIYEPWHYRYVGADIAAQIRDLGITLEEYLQFTHE